MLEKALNDGFVQARGLMFSDSIFLFIFHWISWLYFALEAGHRDLSIMFTPCQKMTWKTSASSHVQAFVINFAVLFELLRVCSNGLIPDAMLEKADLYVSLLK